MRNLRIFAALFLAFGSLFFIQPAQAQTVQFTYYWTAQSFTFTDRLVSVVVTNNITNSVNRGPVADTYRISVGNNILVNTSEIHAARTYTFAINGTQTVLLEGIDNGFWAGYYGPIMQITSEPLAATPQPEPTSTASPESTLSPESQSATSSPDLSSPSSESVSPEVEPSESAPVEPTPSPSESSPIESQSPQVTQSPEATPVTESPTTSPTTSPQPESSSPQPTPIIWDYIVNEGWMLQASAPVSMVFSGVIARYVAHDSDCGIDVSQIVGAVFIGNNMASIGADNGVFGDPCPGWYKKLTVAFTYANDPSATPTQSPTVSPEPTPTPTPEPTQTPQPTPEPSPEPTPQPTLPQPVEPSPPVDPTPEPTPEPVEPTPTPTPEPEPSPTTTPEPTPTEQPEPEPSETAQPSPTPDPEPEEPAPTVDLEPEPSPEPKPEAPESIEEIASDTPIEDVVAVIENIVPTSLTEEQVAVLVSIAMETFETAEQGSPEYEAALDLLLVAAQADDIVLDEELAAIPLIGNVAGAAVEVFNALGNAGADMSPQVREQSEKVVIAAVIVGQVAMTAVASATSAASVAARRP